MKRLDDICIKLPGVVIPILIVMSIITTNSALGYQLGATFVEILILLIGSLVTIKVMGNKRILNAYLKCLIPLMIVTIIEIIIYKQTIFLWLRVVALLGIFIGVNLYAETYQIDIVRVFYYCLLIYIIADLLLYAMSSINFFNLPYKIFTKSWLPEYRNYYFLLYNRTDLLECAFGPFHIIRNEGIFTEPGVFAMLLDIELLIYYFSSFKKKKWHLWMILVCLLTTISTTGLMIAILICGFEQFANRKINSNFTKVVVFVGALLIGVIVSLWLLGQKLEHAKASFDWRMIDWKDGFYLFLKRPLTGWGYRNFEVYEMLLMEKYNYARGNSNAISSVLYQMGIVGALIYICPVFKLIFSQSKNEKRKICFIFITFFLILMSQPILDSSIFLLITGGLYFKAFLKKYFVRE